MFQVTAENGGTIRAGEKEFLFVGDPTKFADWRVAAELEGRALRSLGRALHAFETGSTSTYANACDVLQALHEQLSIARARVQDRLRTFAWMFTPPGLLDLAAKDAAWDALEQAAREFCALFDSGALDRKPAAEAIASPGA